MLDNKNNQLNNNKTSILHTRENHDFLLQKL